MSKKTLLLAMALYIGSAVASYSVFSTFSPKSTSIVQTPDSQQTEDANMAALLEIDPSEPRDQECPLNGAMFTNTEKEAWSKRRPLFVMLENSVDARPQSGLNNADIVFEAVAEGGVTRFGALFYCNAQANDITLAPIRSARTYFVDWTSGFNLPMYVHVGGANVSGPSNALGQIADYGWNMQNDINQFSVGYPTFVRNYNRINGKELATEHTMETSTEKLWEVAEEREWTNLSPERKYGRKTVGGDEWLDGFEGWTFTDQEPAVGSTTVISYDFWSGYNKYSVKWEFDSESKMYKRFNGGEKHLDLNTNEQIAAKTVVVAFMVEKGPINEVKHLLYTTTGTGSALIFANGSATEAVWTKKTRESELQFVDKKGKPVEMARGLTWISVLPKGNKVEY